MNTDKSWMNAALTAVLMLYGPLLEYDSLNTWHTTAARTQIPQPNNIMPRWPATMISELNEMVRTQYAIHQATVHLALCGTLGCNLLTQKKLGKINCCMSNITQKHSFQKKSFKHILWFSSYCYSDLKPISSYVLLDTLEIKFWSKINQNIWKILH